MARVDRIVARRMESARKLRKKQRLRRVPNSGVMNPNTGQPFRVRGSVSPRVDGAELLGENDGRHHTGSQWWRRRFAEIAERLRAKTLPRRKAA